MRVATSNLLPSLPPELTVLSRAVAHQIKVRGVADPPVRIAGFWVYVVLPDWLALVEFVYDNILSLFFSEVTLRMRFFDIGRLRV